MLNIVAARTGRAMASNLALVEQIAQRLFVGGGWSDRAVGAMVATVVESLPTYIDDLTNDLGPEVYHRMLRDTVVAPAVETRRLSALAAPISVVPPEGTDPKDEADARNALATRAREDLAAGTLSLRNAASEIYDGLLLGIKVSELTLLRRSDRQGRGRLVPKAATGLDERGYVILEGYEGEFLGVAPHGLLTPELDALLKSGEDSELARSYWRRIVPAWKLLKLSHRPRNGRIVGGSILRPVYQPYFNKTKLIPEYFKFLARFGSPSVVGTVSEDVQELAVKKDKDGLPIIVDGEPVLENAIRQLFQELLGFRNGSVFAGPHGTDVKLLWPQGNGPSFPEGYDLFKREIHEAILGTAQTTIEARFESRSAKGVAQDVTGLRTADDRIAIAEALDPLLRLLVIVNEGERYAADAPRFQIAATEQHDLGEMSEAFERLQRTPGALLPSQRRWFWDRMGIPVDESELAAEMAERKADREARRVSDLEMEELLDPVGGRRPAVEKDDEEE